MNGSKLLEYIAANFQRQPDLLEVANHVHLSEFHFQRIFSEWAGVSPKEIPAIPYPAGIEKKHSTNSGCCRTGGDGWDIFGFPGS